MAGIHREACANTAEIEGNGGIANSLYQKDILSMKELSLSQIKLILKTAEKIKLKQIQPALEHKIIANCFFESSTRTRLSFESATLRLKGNVIGFSNADHLSTQKGESLQDTIRVIADYADLLIIRHPLEGSARLAADIANIPVINAGDGANQHPTQALTDLFSMQESQGNLNELSIALVGDLKNGRTVHSLLQACHWFNIRVYLVAPEALTLSDAACDYLKRKSVRFSFHQSLDEIIHKVDILYMTRVQRERMSGFSGKSVINELILKKSMLEKAKPTMKVLHPLPRVGEMDADIDDTPFAYYFQQAANGVFVRQALLSLILNQELA